jgi:hypothetical protein
LLQPFEQPFSLFHTNCIAKERMVIFEYDGH